ncbi:MAG: hypothetical protein JNG86_06630 [Verrucomicrobiaceae bacterium]|nr:hypothetical protein [Verrucomicrobiaceae bacterium]
MTGLLVRDAYFPDESRFAEVPPRYVFDLFLKQAEVNADTLHLYHREEKIGHATLNISSSGSGDVKVYAWIARGIIERLQQKGEAVNATWEFSGLMDAQGNWDEVEFLAAMPRQNASVKMRWQEGSAFPNVTVQQDGKTVLDSKNIGLLMALGVTGAQGAGGDLLKALGQMNGPPQEMESFRLSAREGSIELAGRERKCFVVTAPLPGGQEVRMIFGETGELARIELPQDYRLLEPMIHGMIPPLETATQAP